MLLVVVVVVVSMDTWEAPGASSSLESNTLQIKEEISSSCMSLLPGARRGSQKALNTVPSKLEESDVLWLLVADTAGPCPRGEKSKWMALPKCGGGVGEENIVGF